jgi:hypothetical protein
MQTTGEKIQKKKKKKSTQEEKRSAQKLANNFREPSFVFRLTTLVLALFVV